MDEENKVIYRNVIGQKADRLRRCTATIIILEILFIVLTYVCYSIDTNPTDLGIVKEFINNEIEYAYTENADLKELTQSAKSVSTLLKSYNSLRFDIEINGVENSISAMADADELYTKLLPSNLDSAADYIKPCIYTFAIHDVRNKLNFESEHYWNMEAKYLRKLRLHEVYLYNSFRGWLYNSMQRVSMVLFIGQITLMSVGFCLIGYYFMFIKSAFGKRNK